MPFPSPLCPFAASREANRLPPRPAPSISGQSNRTGQISGCKARATFIRVHSCSFVVQNHPCIRIHSWFKTPPFVPIRIHSWLTHLHSCPFVSIRGSKPPLHSHPFVVQNTPCIPHCDYPCKSVLIRGEMAHARPWPRACSGNTINRTRAGKPELHSIVFIRVHSWFKTPPFAVQTTSIRGSNRPADNSATNRN